MTVYAHARERRPSGEQYVLTDGTTRAEIAQVGATLRTLSVAGQPVIDGFAADERCTDGRGQVLAPWPNRISDGRYRFGDVECQAPLNEPARHDAIHGLVRWIDWYPIERDPTSVTLACDLRPQPGYEWQLALQILYQVGDSGLTVRMQARNVDTQDAPFGVGFHPYLTLGGRSIDDLLLRVPADRWSDDPAGVDFTEARLVEGTRLDTAYSELRRDDDGLATATLTDPASGHGLRLWVDGSFRHLMIYTGDRVGGPERRRRAIAIEPMTCPPDAFRTGQDVVTLAPGQTWQGSWGLSVI